MHRKGAENKWKIWCILSGSLTIETLEIRKFGKVGKGIEDWGTKQEGTLEGQVDSPETHLPALQCLPILIMKDIAKMLS